MNRAHHFHEVKIGVLTFRGTVTVDGLSIEAWANKEFLGTAPLGICSVVFDEAWYVVKYMAEHRISLMALKDQERKEFMREFGISILDSKVVGLAGRRKLGLEDPFFASPAFSGLCRWVRQHPKVAKRYAEYQHYLGDWHSRAWSTS